MRCFRLVRFLVCGIFASFLHCSTTALGAELLKGVVFFDVPSFLQAGPEVNGDPALIACYTGRENMSGKSSLMLNIYKHPIGFDKAGREHPVDENSLKKEMVSFFNPWKTNGVNITHVSEVSSATLGSQRAIRISFDLPSSGGRAKELLHAEHYWVQCDNNMAVWIVISAKSEAGLKSLRDSLSSLRIVKQVK